ncbi:uncharacterized protein LOC133384357 [Rhineura floridana]|uniref:uncharacterized protein LOC133384357 n=1 Tax=Rhineura floridana TaxID=261503 RepID=UPI002AC85C13|nr:uncharacterized protein LOC133384357 [Rhineura floridana]XP_061482248.1 uncharacterized protein LOC133384357 [Rhineura floridana]
MGRTHASTNSFGFKSMLGTILCLASLYMVYVYFSASFPTQETRVCSRQRRSFQKKRENVFVELAQEVAKGFNLTNCWICGSPKGFPQWPWIGFPLAPRWLLSNRSEVHVNLSTWTEPHEWELYESSLGKYCLQQNASGGKQLGYSSCNWTMGWHEYCILANCPVTNCTKFASKWNSTHVQFKNGTWCKCTPGSNDKEMCGYKCKGMEMELMLCQLMSCKQPQIFKSHTWMWKHLNGTLVHGFQSYWATWNQSEEDTSCNYKNESHLWKCTLKQGENVSYITSPLGPQDTYYLPYDGVSPILYNVSMPALKGHYWICGQKAYAILPLNWTGICYVGIIQPMYSIKGGNLNPLIPVFDEEQSVRRKRAIDTSLTKGQGNDWEDTWPPERIIATYDPASWAHDGTAGYRGPIYILNRLIRLQAVLEIITNQTAKALTLLADQSTQMREGILQNRLALDYLLAKEGGVCGLLNLTECCLKIDDNGEVVKDIANKIKNLLMPQCKPGKE